MEILNVFKDFFFPSLEPEINSLSLSDCNIFILKGEFDLGYSLDQHSVPLHKIGKRTKIGELLLRFKYRYDESTGEILTSLVVSFIEDNEFLRSSQLFTTVPPSFTSRPFDPMCFLAEKLSSIVKIPFVKNAFERTRIIRLQKDIRGMKLKVENVKGAFRVVNPHFFKGKRILLLDDIYDSGATLDELTQLLKSCGVDNIFVLALTKTGYRKCQKYVF